MSNNTWSLVPHPPGVNLVTGKWIFRHKFHADGSLDRYKARWLLRGFTQCLDIDYYDTFNPVVKPAIVCTVLSLALSLRTGRFISSILAVHRRPDGLFLSQPQYILDVFECAGMSDCKPCSTPVDTHAKLSALAGDLLSDATHYRSLTGALQYLIFTRLDIPYGVLQVCLHMHAPRDPHLSAVK